MYSLLRSLAALVLIITATGCVTDDSASVSAVYQAPVLNQVEVAYLKGTKIKGSGLFAAEHSGFVLMVDRTFVKEAQGGWNRSIALSPGWHEISCKYQSSVFSSRAVFNIEAQAGITYELKIAPGMEGEDERRYCDFSIVDAATGNPLTAVKRCAVTTSQSTTNFRPLD